MLEINEAKALEFVSEDSSRPTYLTLDISGQILGIEVCHVREILDFETITRIPNAPIDVLGVVDVRGASVPIVDIQSRLGLAPTYLEDEARLVVLELGKPGETYPLGIRADRVRDVEQISLSSIEQVPKSGFGKFNYNLLNGLYRKNGDLVVLVNLGEVFSTEEHDLLLPS